MSVSAVAPEHFATRSILIIDLDLIYFYAERNSGTGWTQDGGDKARRGCED